MVNIQCALTRKDLCSNTVKQTVRCMEWNARFAHHRQRENSSDSNDAETPKIDHTIRDSRTARLSSVADSRGGLRLTRASQSGSDKFHDDSGHFGGAQRRMMHPLLVL